MTINLNVLAGSASLAVAVDGAEGLPWLIVSNSLATNKSMWDDQLADLMRLRRVVRYDTRGHGVSSAPAGAYDFAGLTADVIAIMDHLRIAQADVLGLSLGGMTALGLGLDHPDRINKVICCSARADFPPAAIAAWDDRIKAVSDGGMAAVVEGTLGRWFTEATHKERPAVVERARQMILSTSVAGYCGCVQALKGLDYLRRLPQLRKPALFVAGASDSSAPPAAMREMAANTAGACYLEIPNAAHIANMENVALFNQAVFDFL